MRFSRPEGLRYRNLWKTQDRCSDRPAQEHGSDRKSRADRRKEHEIALPQTPVGDGIGERQGNRARRRISLFFDVDDHLLRREAQAICG